MEYLCTTCCQRKRRDPQPLPARDRYLSRRIRFVLHESRRLQKPMFILSGKYGLLKPSQKILWYDHALSANEVAAFSLRVARQLTKHAVSRVLFYALPRKTPGWQPYYDAIATACARLKVALEYKTLNNFL